MKNKKVIRQSSISNHLLVICIVVLTSGVIWSQQKPDSVRQMLVKKKGLLTAGATLSIAGAVLQWGTLDQSIHDKIRSSIAIPETNIDDYMQYVPTAQYYSYGVLTGRAKTRIWQDTKYYLLSQASTLSVTYALKFATNRRRPNGGSLSYPSGHTAHAFAGATAIFWTYRDQSMWLALSGYLPALTTAYYRVAKDKHWVSDVLTGAGLGILVPSVFALSHKLTTRPANQEMNGLNYQFGIYPGGIYALLTF